jgi:response regulator RpfG family c-di-GMP phosphodiesterase
MKHQVRVLIVDNREVFDVMEPVLRREINPEQLTHCESHEAAMAAIKDRTKYDMIFADWGIAGNSFVAAVRDSFTNHYAPIIVTTNFDDDELVAQVMRSGATGLIVKPFLEKGLVAKIRRISQSIEHRRHHRVEIKEPIAVNAELERKSSSSRTSSMQMVNISADGCRVKVPLSCDAQIYDNAKLAFSFRDSDFSLPGHLLRLEAEPELAKTGGEYIYASFVFSDVSDEMHENLNQMLDELSEYELQQP